MTCIGILQGHQIADFASVCYGLHLNGQFGTLIGALMDTIELARAGDPSIRDKCIVIDEHDGCYVFTLRGISVDRSWSDRLNALHCTKGVNGDLHFDGLAAHLTDFYVPDPIIMVSKTLGG